METRNATGDALSIALWFAFRAWPIIPIHGVNELGGCLCGRGDCESPGKHPIAALAPHGLKDASTDEAVIRDWFARFPGMNYGVRCDEFFVIDADLRSGGDRAGWQDLRARNADPHTWRVWTGGGGWHLYFQAPQEPVRCKSLARGFDVKTGAGAYVIGPGSKHASGKLYKWAHQCVPGETDWLPVPQWVLTRIKKQAPKAGEPRDEAFLDGLIVPAKEGERTIKMTALLGHLYGSIKPDRRVLAKLAQCFNQVCYDPPLDEGKVYEIARNLAALEDKKVRGR